VTPAVIYTGGIAHDFEPAAAALGRVLAPAGFAARVTLELDELADALAREPRTLAIVYALRFSMTQHEKYAPDRPRWALTTRAAQRDALTRHVAAGGGLLGLHTASICFDDWPEWSQLLGGSWVWGQSHHPPAGPVEVTLSRDHLLTRGLPDFELIDEAYSEQRREPGIDVAGYVAVPGGPPQPALWAQRYGAGRVIYDSLGHDVAAIELPVHARLLRRAALWVTGAADSQVEAA